MGGGRGPAFGRPRPAIPGAKLALHPEWLDAKSAVLPKGERLISAPAPKKSTGIARP